MSSGPAPAPAAPRGPSRRALLIGAVGVGVAAGGGISAAALALRPHPPGPSAARRLLAERTFRVAHRGGSDDWPEMSAFAYRQAISHGYQALEISVGRSSDGVWFGLHDYTLDRTSGTKGFAAEKHTWAEISSLRISAAGTTHPGQAARPYLRLRDFLTEFATSHVVFIDPKATQPGHHPELVREITQALPDAQSRVVAKGPGAMTAWARLAKDAGLSTWGYYYEPDVTSGVLARTASAWELLGMDIAASDATWDHIRTIGKPVIAHVLHTGDQDRSARIRRASGEMIAGVLAVRA
jgi:hypothetical protein